MNKRKKQQKKPGKRRQARELALQILYSCELTGYSIKEASQAYSELETPEKIASNEFTSRILTIVHRLKEELDADLQKAITNWKIERLSVIDRNLLRLAAAEIFHIEDIPPKVTMNEYIEIAKEFGDNDSPGFINGILDRIVRESPKSGEMKERKNSAGGGTRTPTGSPNGS